MYKYENLRQEVFTESGVKMLLDIRDKIQKLCKESGVCTFEKAMTSGDSWHQLACLDFLVEIGDVRKVGNADGTGQGQLLTWLRS